MSTVITGAARGIGLALTKRYAARGIGRVYGVVRDASAATELEELSGESSGRVHVVEADVTDAAALRRLAKKIAATDEPIDVLINNAGIGNWKSFGELTEDDLRETFRVNASGPLLVTQALRPNLARGAKIVNVTSTLGSIERAGADYLIYGMSKAALNMFSKKLALAMHDDGIAVLALHPGWVRTRMGGEGAAIDVDTSADGMIACIDALDLAHSGSYLAYDGSAIPLVMREYAYSVVDVFAEAPLEGNPLAVVHDARGLDDVAMARIAREFNLSETVFVLPARRASCAVRFRIFTPTMEMRFAGHPTVGGTWVALERELIADAETFAIDEEIGDVPVRIDRSDGVRVWLTTPPIAFGERFDPALCAEVLGLERDDLLDVPPQLLSAGNPNVYIAVRDASTVDRAWLDLGGVRRLHGGAASSDCVFVFTPTPAGAYARMFAPEHGVVEDPATGSATGPLAAYMMAHGLAPHADGARFHSEQGTKMGRRSILEIAIRGEHGRDGIDVGGRVVPFATGTLRAP